MCCFELENPAPNERAAASSGASRLGEGFELCTFDAWAFVRTSRREGLGFSSARWGLVFALGFLIWFGLAWLGVCRGSLLWMLEVLVERVARLVFEEIPGCLQ